MLLRATRRRKSLPRAVDVIISPRIFFKTYFGGYPRHRSRPRPAPKSHIWVPTPRLPPIDSRAVQSSNNILISRGKR